eukprot:3227779-Rhodomonas_salina.1
MHSHMRRLTDLVAHQRQLVVLVPAMPAVSTGDTSGQYRRYPRSVPEIPGPGTEIPGRGTACVAHCDSYSLRPSSLLFSPSLTCICSSVSSPVYVMPDV